MQVFVTREYLLFTDLERFEGTSVLSFLASFKRSKKNIYLDFLHQRIQVNGIVAKEATLLHTNDELVVYKEEEKMDFECADVSCEVIYEDDLLLAVHKESGIIIHDDNGNNALANQVATYYQKSGQVHPVRYLHRLDRDTSGIVLFSKELFFQPLLDEMMMHKEIKRKYYAWVKGKMREGSFTIHKPIGKDRHVNGKMCISSTGKEAITHIEVMEVREDYSLVRCELETGRTHQIRVHLASIGHPIVNDSLYGSKDKRFNQMGLWAYELVFMHPISGELVTIKDELVDITSFVK
ncbi:MAG: RluA family pseudouridine synthase [Erysipelotrichaceae bacterium]|nr:RluA family pseudouridine synthase [Erysipelotrichaceae bacterium]